MTQTLTLWPINSGVMTSLPLPHLLSYLTDSLSSLNLKNWCSIHAIWSKNTLKHSIRFCGIFSKFHQLWQSGFSRVYSNCCCSCSFEPKIIKIGQSFHKMYRNNILNFPESTTILNACTKTKGLETYWMYHVYIYIYIYIYIYMLNSI